MSASTTAASGSSATISLGGFGKCGAHVSHQESFGSTTATTTCGRSAGRRVSASAIWSWSRPSTVDVDQPFTSKRDATPPGQPWLDDWLSTTIAVRFASPIATGVRDRFVVGALVEFGVADQDEDP